MSIPVFTGPYDPQTSIGAAALAFDVHFADGVSGAGWSADVTVFEMNVNPPGVIFDPATGLITGNGEVLMDYYISIRAGNADGFAEFEELRWTISSGFTSGRTLHGLSADWPAAATLASGTAATLFFKRMTNDGNEMLISDVAEDGNASDYDTPFRRSQIILNGVADTFLRGTLPGITVIIDTN